MKGKLGIQQKKIIKQIKKKKTKKPQKIKTPKQESDNSNSSDSQSNNSEEDSSLNQNFEPAIKQMTFRSRRGQNISTLMRKEIQANKEEDEMYQKYFGKAFEDEDDLDDNESYSIDEKIEKADSFDSDFGKDDEEADELEEDTESKSETKGQKIIKNKKDEVEIEDDGAKVIRKTKKSTNNMSLDELMYKKEDNNEINIDDAISSVKSNQEQKKFYIHEYFTQEELLKEAVETECKNKESLDLLVRIEQEKRKINLTGRRVILGPYVKQTIRVFNKDNNNDFIDRPYLQTQTEIHYLNFPDNSCEKLIDNEIFKQKRFIKKKQFKYFDPKTQKGYNTIEEFKQQRKLLGIPVEVQ